MNYSKNKIKIAFFAAEAEPYVKIGGLGDVAGSLPRELYSLSIDQKKRYDENLELDIRMVLPFHGVIQHQNFPLSAVASFTVNYRGEKIVANGLSHSSGRTPVYFISGPLIPTETAVYSGDDQDDGKKYTYFSLAALEILREIHWKPDIIHANDWHTALAIYALKTGNKRIRGYYSNTSTLMGVHNLPYFGPRLDSILMDFGLPNYTGSNLPEWATDIPLPLGMDGADHIVTVSPSYAEEIQTPLYGAGLDEFLRSRSKNISGILNGINDEIWNPEQDPALRNNYGIDRLENRIKNKMAMQQELGFHENKDIPLLGLVSRLDYQKGIDLLPGALSLLKGIDEQREMGWQIVILGTGDPKLEMDIRNLERIYPGRVKSFIRFDDKLSRRIYSAADILLIPSRYEPCGLTQMYAMRYGCIPLGRRTGGLRDTIDDYFQAGESTGFLFDEADSASLSEVIHDALQIYKQKEQWEKIQLNAMKRDFSWRKSAKLYEDLYLNLLMEKEQRAGVSKDGG